MLIKATKSLGQRERITYDSTEIAAARVSAFSWAGFLIPVLPWWLKGGHMTHAHSGGCLPREGR